MKSTNNCQCNRVTEPVIIDVLCFNDLQFGFKPKHSTAQCTFVLQEVIDLYFRNDASLYLVLLDASKAFDRVKYCKLFEILVNKNMCSCYVRLIINMYTTQKLRVKWGDTVSLDFNCLNGVKQGGVLSPILFCIYMDELLSRLNNCGVVAILESNSWAVCAMQMILRLYPRHVDL
jgi:hypothetical protein